MSIKDIVYALIVNIALLAIIANLLSRIQTVQKLILQEKRGLKGDLILSMIFAGLIILSTCIGVKITSYSLNTRVIGAMSAGLLGGPLVGLYSSEQYMYLSSRHREHLQEGLLLLQFCSDFWEQDSTLIFKEASGNIRICSCWHVLQKSVTWHPCFA